MCIQLEVGFGLWGLCRNECPVCKSDPAQGHEPVEHECTVSLALPDMCAGAELHTTHHPNSNPAVAVQSVAICTPKCTNAWSSDAHRRCVLAAGESDAAHHAALEDMADDCDTICFLDSGATLEQFKEACNPIFEGKACPDTCRYAPTYAHASVWSHYLVGARNALILDVRVHVRTGL